MDFLKAIGITVLVVMMFIASIYLTYIFIILFIIGIVFFGSYEYFKDESDDDWKINKDTKGYGI